MSQVENIKGNQILNQNCKSPPQIPIVQTQGFFRLSDPKKTKASDIVTPIQQSFKIPGYAPLSVQPKILEPRNSNIENQVIKLVPNSAKSPISLKSAPKDQVIFSPQFMGNTEKNIIQNDENTIEVITELKNCLNNKEIEVLDLRNEKMRLEMTCETQKKEIKDKNKELETVRKILEEYKLKAVLDPASEDYSNRIQKILKAQQETHNDSLAKFKEKVYF